MFMAQNSLLLRIMPLYPGYKTWKNLKVGLHNGLLNFSLITLQLLIELACVIRMPKDFQDCLLLPIKYLKVIDLFLIVQTNLD